MTGADVSEVAHAIGTDSRIGSKFLTASVGEWEIVVEWMVDWMVMMMMMMMMMIMVVVVMMIIIIIIIIIFIIILECLK